MKRELIAGTLIFGGGLWTMAISILMLKQLSVDFCGFTDFIVANASLVIQWVFVSIAAIIGVMMTD
jgi:hypothetical protein